MNNKVLLKSVRNYFDFLWVMTEKELKSRYKRAVFGFLWVVLNPLFQMLIIGLVFSFFIKIENYYLFLFSGLLPWQFFSLSLTKTTTSFVFERSLLQKAKFSKEIIPLSIILANFVNLLVSIILLVGLLIFLGILPGFKALLVVPAIVWLLGFTIGLSLLTATLNVRYRDVAFIVQALLTLWFYATPIVYSLGIIPEGIRKLYVFNPLAGIFEWMHFAFGVEKAVDLDLMGVNLLISVLVAMVGVRVYRKQHKYFVDWL